MNPNIVITKNLGRSACPTIVEFHQAIAAGERKTAPSCTVVNFNFRGVPFHLVRSLIGTKTIDKYKSARAGKEFFFHTRLSETNAEAVILAACESEEAMGKVLAEIGTAVAERANEGIVEDLTRAGFPAEDAQFFGTWIRDHKSLHSEKMLVIKLRGTRDLLYANQLTRKGTSVDIIPAYQRLISDVFSQVLDSVIDDAVNPTHLDTMVHKNRGYQWKVMSMIVSNFAKDPRFADSRNLVIFLRMLVDFYTFKVGGMDLGDAMKDFGFVYRESTSFTSGRVNRIGDTQEWRPSTPRAPQAANSSAPQQRQQPRNDTPRGPRPPRVQKELGSGADAFKQLDSSKFPATPETAATGEAVAAE